MNFVTDERGIVFDIKKYALHDGPGIRTTVFLKGCPLTCPWCHNPEGQSFAPERITRTISTADGTSRERTEIIGQEMTTGTVIAEIEKDVLFYDESGGGATFSGGEPLSRPRFLAALLSACRDREIHTAVDTTGHASPDVFAEIAALADLFLFDLKIMDPEQHLRYTGVSTDGILENLRYLDRIRKPVTVRFPLIPGMTDAPENVAVIARFLTGLETIRHVTVLPFHNTASGKYGGLAMQNRLADAPSPDPAAVAQVVDFFSSRGLRADAGGE